MSERIERAIAFVLIGLTAGVGLAVLVGDWRYTASAIPLAIWAVWIDWTNYS